MDFRRYLAYPFTTWPPSSCVSNIATGVPHILYSLITRLPQKYSAFSPLFPCSQTFYVPISIILFYPVPCFSNIPRAHASLRPFARQLRFTTPALHGYQIVVQQTSDHSTSPDNPLSRDTPSNSIVSPFPLQLRTPANPPRFEPAQ